MSFNPPRLKKVTPQSRTTHNSWVQPSKIPTRRPYGTSNVQILPRVDLYTTEGPLLQETSTSSHKEAAEDDGASTFHGTPRKLGRPISPTKQSHGGKVKAQYTTWIRSVIPAMVPVFLTLLRLTSNLRNMRDAERRTCNCMATVHKLTVNLISFEGTFLLLVQFSKLMYPLETSVTSVCSCSPATTLLSMGFFPSTPSRPTFAVSLNLLDFARELYLRTPPNITAWCDTLQAFLSARGFAFQSNDIVRRKLASSLKWYSYLLARKEHTVEQLITFALDNDNADGSDDEGDIDEAPIGVEYTTEEITHDNKPAVSRPPHPLASPSAYLRRRCVACFGGNVAHHPDLLADVIVSVDGNFTQKRRSPARGTDSGPPLQHPDSVFVSKAELNEAEAHVEACRSRRRPTAASNDEDHIESGMRVPVSVLDGCQESFKAADEKRTKASTTFFSDTGLMALLCPHDHVLWLANMTSAGERQFYVVALLRKLFANLPKSTTIGLLYDVACQLHRSCVKWGLLGDDFPRMIFAVSVFHAYGHQWPCQVVYHPRKCKGFGLCDGEGCERFWSAISHLIPSLRVSGVSPSCFLVVSRY
jgi:Kyakuja-Dileera-Zisupton transposase/CxC1 like cysteine cluster associated with KDZ transposases